MKIAVCISGQPRVMKYTVHNTIHFFNTSNFQIDYFCHTWDYNSYKRKNTGKDADKNPVWWEEETAADKNEILNYMKILNPKKYIIHSKSNLHFHFPWNSMFYSMMYANHLKREYEFENNFTYDLVVKTRYDEVYDPNATFIIDSWFNPKNYLDIYCTHKLRMEYEYNRINTSDAFFYGSSMAMDIMTDVFWQTFELNKESYYDDFECLGPGVRMQNLCEHKNLNLKPVNFPETVYRKECIPLDPMIDYDKIKKFNLSLYSGTSITEEFK